jgi:hypothetical protein
VVETQVALQAGSVALRLRVIVFCWVSNESLDPPPQAANMPPIRLRVKVLVTRDFMVLPLSPNDLYGFSALVFEMPTFAAFPRHTFDSSAQHTHWFFSCVAQQHGVAMRHRQVVCTFFRHDHTSA